LQVNSQETNHRTIHDTVQALHGAFDFSGEEDLETDMEMQV
jgi:hypothetical protein